MMYLATQIFISLFVAAVLGVLIGWWVRALRSQGEGSRALGELERSRQRVAEMEREIRMMGTAEGAAPPTGSALRAVFVLTELEAAKAKLQEDVDALRQELEQTRGLAREREHKLTALRESSPQSSDARDAREEQEIEALREALFAAKRRTADVVAELARAEARAQAAEAAAGEKVDADRAQGAAMEERLAAQIAAADAARATAEEVTAATRTRLSDLERRLADAELTAASSSAAAVAAVRSEHEETRQRLEALEAEHADCEFAFTALRTKILNLKEEVRAASSRAPAAPPTSSKPLGTAPPTSPRPRVAAPPTSRVVAPPTSPRPRVAARATLPKPPGATRPTSSAPVAARQLRNGSAEHQGVAPGGRPGILRTAPDRIPDDLKQINGVGPRLERLLNRLGLYYFDQVAGLSASDIAWLDDHLEEFKGRIQGDDWVMQAKNLKEGRLHVKEY
jgi:predicted flap endonuclease-1-like 5' DNA nuclease